VKTACGQELVSIPGHLPYLLLNMVVVVGLFCTYFGKKERIERLAGK